MKSFAVYTDFRAYSTDKEVLKMGLNSELYKL